MGPNEIQANFTAKESGEKNQPIRAVKVAFQSESERKSKLNTKDLRHELAPVNDFNGSQR